jgi:ribosomal protein S18 acetylase RimI-like enzyme
MTDAGLYDDSLLVESLAARAWPASGYESIDGWVLRHTPSVLRRRSNSALPPIDGARRLQPILGSIIRFYRCRQLEPIIQVTPAEAHASLDAELRKRGWELRAPTDVMVASAKDVANLSCAADVSLAVDSQPDLVWLDAWRAIERRSDALETYRCVLARIQPRVGYATAAVGGTPVGVGFCVCERGWSGVFCMATAQAVRRRGIARAVLRTLAQWSARNGADRLYLQVECDNGPAQALYAGAGFSGSHTYHYRCTSTKG